MRRVHFTIRRLMVIVAVFGVGLAILKSRNLIGTWLLATSLMAALWMWGAKRSRPRKQPPAVVSRVIVLLGYLALTVLLSLGLCWIVATYAI